jgi:hypothetical protein
METNEEKSNTQNSEEYENFVKFTRQILRVPKSELDKAIREERQKEKEEHPDPLAQKQKEKEQDKSN